MCSDPLTLRLGAVLVPLLWSFDLLGSGLLGSVLVPPWICCFYLPVDLCSAFILLPLK
jgi:hypothetical protein